MQAPDTILKLVERFEENIDQYRSPRYNEAQLRTEFANPFFIALGWDVFNEKGYAEAYKEVVHEAVVKVGGATKAPDYSFRIGGTRKFFVETKKPAINLSVDPLPAFQLRRYAWSAKLPLSILTDFEEFAVYDTRIKPAKNDKASVGRIINLTYRDYTDRWEEIADIFSPTAIRKGSFDKYVETTRKKKGTAEVDDAFLKDIESWRDELARNIALRNPGLSTRELNFAVQRIIDRIIFLRICEDRGIEEYGELQSLLKEADIYPRLVALFNRADERYNSGLFHFNRERGRPQKPDTLTPTLKIDDKVPKEIIKDLYYPESPYEFSVLPADILGQVYEQFLGKVIRLTPGHRAVVEEKPEVKKAGGVYYTPTYIVDYIVENTVGKLLEGKTPRQVSKLRILDPACGSGSFLIGAYQKLLDWHQDWFVNDGPERHRKELYESAPPASGGGEWRLTTAERRRILLNNIYGVDIDPQAVEVTKLSLLLKVLEGESGETLNRQLEIFRERALPDLATNIKCGNSLIGPDFYQGRQMSLLSDEERLRINAFDWKAEFGEIMGPRPPAIGGGGGGGISPPKAGFDAVIGNPPYIPIETMASQEKEYFQSHYTQLQRKYDSSIVFILAMIEKLSKGGVLGFISSIAWQTGENFSKLREFLFTSAGVLRLVNLPFDVFKKAYVDTGVYVFSRAPSEKYHIYRFPKREKFPDLENINYIEVPTELVSAPEYKIILNPEANAILRRISLNEYFEPLGSLTVSTQGLASGRFNKKSTCEGKNWYPFLTKGQVYRYRFEIERIDFADMSENKSLRKFYENEKKLLIRRVINRRDRLMVSYTDMKLVFKKDINPFVIVDHKLNVYFLLGVLNSRLISYIYVNTSAIATKDDFRQTTLAELRRLPIRTIDFDDLEDVKRHDLMVALVEDMLELHKKLASARTDHERDALKRQIDATDRQIDNLVYELYGLTEEEIRVVEGGG